MFIAPPVLFSAAGAMILAAPVRIVSSPATNTTGVYTPAIISAGAVVEIAGV